MSLATRSAMLCGMLLAVAAPLRSQVAFGEELFHFATASTNVPPGTCALKAKVPVGAMIVVLGAEDGNDYHIASISDSQGNSYSEKLYYHNTQYQPTEQSIWSAPVTHALAAGDTVNIRWSAPTTEWRSYAVSIVSVAGASDQPVDSAKNNAYMDNGVVHVPGKIRSPNTIILGLLVANDFEWKIAAGWTIYRSEPVNIHYNFFYKVFSSAGAADPAGSGPPANTYSGVWAAFSGSPNEAKQSSTK